MHLRRGVAGGCAAGGCVEVRKRRGGGLPGVQAAGGCGPGMYRPSGSQE